VRPALPWIEPGAGQLLTASFMDYAMLRADTMCGIAIKSNPVPTKTNPPTSMVQAQRERSVPYRR
jgi:hypothetical protein